MTEITTLLRAASAGDSQAADQVVALLYGELHRLARSRMRRSGELTLLDTTALVHESYLRIQQAGGGDFPDRQHFLGYAAKVMRTVVVDLVRARRTTRSCASTKRWTTWPASTNGWRGWLNCATSAA